MCHLDTGWKSALRYLTSPHLVLVPRHYVKRQRKNGGVAWVISHPWPASASASFIQNVPCVSTKPSFTRSPRPYPALYPTCQLPSSQPFHSNVLIKNKKLRIQQQQRVSPEAMVRFSHTHSFLVLTLVKIHFSRLPPLALCWRLGPPSTIYPSQFLPLCFFLQLRDHAWLLCFHVNQKNL